MGCDGSMVEPQQFPRATRVCAISTATSRATRAAVAGGSSRISTRHMDSLEASLPSPVSILMEASDPRDIASSAPAQRKAGGRSVGQLDAAVIAEALRRLKDSAG
jgi:hypothetical protein